MGSPLSPLLAETYLQHIEKTIVHNHPIQPVTWLRYVDDIFVIWPSTKEELVKLTDNITKTYPTIRFTLNEELNNTIHFLDVTVTRTTDNKITRSVYRKPTAATNIIPYNSHTPRNYKLSSLKSFIHRAHLICDTPESLTNEYANILKIAKEHEYPEHIVKSLFNNYKNKRTQHYNTIQQNKQHLPYIGSIPYYPTISYKLKNIFKQHGHNLVIKNNRNVMNIVLRDRDPVDQLDLPGVYSIPVKTASGDVKYIGSTVRSLRRRLQEHKKDVREGKATTSLSQLTLEDITAEPQWEEARRIAPCNNKDSLLYSESLEIATQTNVCNTEEPIKLPYIWKALFLLPNRNQKVYVTTTDC